ncbi:MAG: type II toxin-antitoxin system VapC family toxin [Deltaproteobacteria bacterium]|nr:type II toxin-antitoxin system VapC family toxin [Deltaproteobacteria bacterium]
MTLAYFDTSVLVKNYVQEAGSARARALLRSHSFLSSSITPVELMSALMRRKSRGELEVEDLPRILARVQEDRPYWKLLDVGLSVLSQAEELIQKIQMRTLDAIHIASLVTFQAASGIRIQFVTGDSRQRDAAEQMNLDVVWIG